jgi:16S rRNA (cytosine967-C5)-methyltransferase
MNAREIALKIINEVSVKDAYANVVLTRELANHALSEQDRRFVTELVYGTVKARFSIDWIISRFVNRPLKKISPIILDILRLGTYQIKFLDRVPPSAACNQSVELAKKYGHKGTTGFVNGVLRNIVRSLATIEYPSREKEPVKSLALEYFHPEWLVKRWLREFGMDGTEKLCAFNNESPPLSIRANTLKIDRERLIAILEKAGVSVERSRFAPEGIICHGHPSMDKFAPLKDGLFQVQDESSMLVAHILAPQPSEFVIDACSAPGGKATHIAALMENKGRVVCNDVYEHKLAKIAENASRLGITIIETSLGDAAKIGSVYEDMADRVLVDAPCTGLGVLRRKSDSRLHKEEGQIKELAALQLEILSGAARAVKKGGVLVYSTCSIEREENSSVVEKFLKNNDDFVLENAAAFMPNEKKTGPMLQFYPQTDGTDGFFIARMKRKE